MKPKSLREKLKEAGNSELYYFNDQGLMVFTEKYHEKRGYCCQNSCIHCPYGFHKRK